MPASCSRQRNHMATDAEATKEKSPARSTEPPLLHAALVWREHEGHTRGWEGLCSHPGQDYNGGG